MRLFERLLLAFAAAGTVVASNGTSQVLVHIPFSLHNPAGFGHVQAEFGFQFRASGSIAEYVYYMERALCTPLAFNRTAGFPKHDNGFQTPFILLANDGDCSAVTKARHAQQVGASALVIADSHCGCADKECMDKFSDEKCQDTRPTLVNDGSGSDISIPSFLVVRSLAHDLKEQLSKNNQPVLMELIWGLKQDVGNSDTLPVYYQLWTTAHDPLVDLETYVNLRVVTSAFKDKAHFAPRYSLIDGSRFGCNKEPDTSGPCDHLCTNHGRYCTTHAQDLSGNAIVKETLRRLCLWKHYGENDQIDVWWDYVLFHKENCHDPHQFADEDCLKQSFAHAKADQQAIDECMADSGDVDQDVPNGMLDDMLNRQKQSSVVSLPAITLNQKVLDHTSTWSLFESICMEYWTSKSPSIPDVCVTCASCPNVIGCLENGHCVDFSNAQRHPEDSGGDKKKKKRHGWTVFWSLAVCMIAGGAWYYHKRRDEFGDRSGLMQGYLQLSGEA